MSASTTPVAATATASPLESVPRTVPCTTISSSLVSSPSIVSPSPINVPAMCFSTMILSRAPSASPLSTELQLEIHVEARSNLCPRLDGDARATQLAAHHGAALDHDRAARVHVARQRSRQLQRLGADVALHPTAAGDFDGSGHGDVAADVALHSQVAFAVDAACHSCGSAQHALIGDPFCHGVCGAHAKSPVRFRQR